MIDEGLINEIEFVCNLHPRCKDCKLYEKNMRFDTELECLLVPPSKIKQNILEVKKRLGM